MPIFAPITVSKTNNHVLDVSFLSWQSATISAALLCAFGISLLIVVTKRHHGHLTLDSGVGVQKFHVDPTPRVGGVGIYLGLLLAWTMVPEGAISEILGVILLAGIPPLVFGLLEDVTKRVGVLPRLLATMAGGVLAWLLSGVALNRLELQGLDWLMAVTPVAVLFTAFAVGGVANAINIIDGFHGLASGTTIIGLLGLAAIAERAEDPQMALACVIVAAAVGGFCLVNWPWGKLFLGDGGAYFSGFAMAWLAVLLTVRNPEVSVWSGLLVCVYPVIEVLYSVVRRYIRRQSPGQADSAHLHSLIKTELIRPALSPLGVQKSMRNAAVSPILWVFTLTAVVAAEALFDSPALLGVAIAACGLLYHLVYRQLAQRRLATSAEAKRQVCRRTTTREKSKVSVDRLGPSGQHLLAQRRDPWVQRIGQRLRLPLCSTTRTHDE